MGLKRAVGYAAASAALLALTACGSDDDSGNRTHKNDEVAATVERVDVDTQGQAPGWFDPVAIGDMLLADFAGTRLMSSEDLGTTWQDVDLPDSPAGFELGTYPSLEIIEGVVVTGGSDGRFPYLWTSTNGLDWQGGRLSDAELNEIFVYGLDGVLYAALGTGTIKSDEVTPFELWRSEDAGASWSPATVDFDQQPGLGVELGGDLWRAEDGQLVVPLFIDAYVAEPGDTSEPTGSPALVSHDDGLTWQLGQCPIPDLPEWSLCDPPEGAPGLAIQYDQVSLDGGATWQQPEFDDPKVGQDSPPEFDHVVELPGGGWLAIGGNNLASQDPLGFLARSDDGLSWDVLLPAEGRPSARVEEPVRFGDSWLVTLSVTGRDQESTPSQLYLLDADGTNLRPIADTQAPGHRYGQPVVAGDMALIAEHESDDEGRAWLVRLTL